MPEDSVNLEMNGLLGHLVRQVLEPNAVVRPWQAYPFEMQRPLVGSADAPSLTFDQRSPPHVDEHSPEIDRIDSVLQRARPEAIRPAAPRLSVEEASSPASVGAGKGHAARVRGAESHHLSTAPAPKASLVDAQRSDAITARGSPGDQDAPLTIERRPPGSSPVAGRLPNAMARDEPREHGTTSAPLSLEASTGALQPTSGTRAQPRRVEPSPEGVDPVATPGSATRDFANPETATGPPRIAAHRTASAGAAAQQLRAERLVPQRTQPAGADATIPVLAVQPISTRLAEQRPAAPPVVPLPQGAAVQIDARTRNSGDLPAGPTVHVTIGRVEIRAIAASPIATSAKPVPALKPALSLTDYLQGRGGGQR